MLNRIHLWKYIKKEFESKSTPKLEKIYSHIEQSPPLSISDLIYLRDKIKSSNYIETYPRICQTILEDIESNIRKKLLTKSKIESISKKIQQYDYDRYFNFIDNPDFKWYLSPKGYESDKKISSKNIKRMYTFINRKLGKMYLFTGKEYNYFFYELDYETKKIILLYHQLQLESIINSEIQFIKKHHPEIHKDILFSHDLDTTEINKIKKMFDEFSKILQSELDTLRQSIIGMEEDDSKVHPILVKIKVQNNLLQRSINLMNMSTAILSSYHSHFLKESQWRIIDIISHSTKGIVYYFGEPISGFWVWTISIDGDFNLGNRQDNLKGGYGSRLPHSTVSDAKIVLGAGEVEFKNGKILRFNSHSGHYYSLSNPEEYNKNCEEIFKDFCSKLGLKGPMEFTPNTLT